jgi:hypothetical protein
MTHYRDSALSSSRTGTANGSHPKRSVSPRHTPRQSARDWSSPRRNSSLAVGNVSSSSNYGQQRNTSSAASKRGVNRADSPRHSRTGYGSDARCVLVYAVEI